MSILLVEKKNINDPMKWFADVMGFEGEWKKDPYLRGYKLAGEADIRNPLRYSPFHSGPR